MAARTGRASMTTGAQGDLAVRTPLAAAWFAGVGVVLTVVGSIVAIAWRVADPVPVVPNTFGFADVSLVGFGFLGVTFSSVGALVVVRRPWNAVGWCMVVIGTSYALAALFAAVTFSAVADGPDAAPTAAVAGWFAVLFSTVGGLMFILGFIFPTGRGHSPAWDRGVRIGALATPALLLFGFLIRPGPLQVFPSIDNPFGFGPDLRPFLGPQPSTAIAASITVFAPVLVWSIASRYRMSDAVGRQQLKWFIVSLLVAVGGISFAALASVLTDRPPEAGLALFGFAGALVPVAIGIAILRYRLYDIDRIISRTLAYAIVTVLLAAIFVTTILALQAVLAPFTQGQTIAVATSTLAVFAIFQPVLRRVRRMVDGRFDRARVDAERTAAAFADRLRGEVDIAAIIGDLDRTARASVRPSTLGIWLRQGHR